MNVKKLGTKELIILVSPLIVGIFVYIFFSNLVREKVIDIWSDYFEYRPQIAEIHFKKKENEFKIDMTLLDSLISVKPFSIPEIRKKETLEKPPPEYKISFIYIGKNRYVIINNRLYKEGDRISPDEKIVRITKDGILLNGKWGERWIKFLK
ncbi:Type II secretion system protein B [Persephonella hydrogeniphila]|uniref:Type II secretion system protein B n=1 Tax=Persephonella hydrogeniphila TaxID=198703 RepID=A0A285N0A2_9AQUI|nr:GspB domain-containing protein [Persephonella hydrogeniphila]SNZ02884.1 Type II secretion system protein B [Persephonella hydrogeniphila]